MIRSNCREKVPQLKFLTQFIIYLPDIGCHGKANLSVERDSNIEPATFQMTNCPDTASSLNLKTFCSLTGCLFWISGKSFSCHWSHFSIYEALAPEIVRRHFEVCFQRFFIYTVTPHMTVPGGHLRETLCMNVGHLFK